MDVAPTLLELLGVAKPASYKGRSLVPLARGAREKDRLAFGSSSVVQDIRRDSPLFSVQDERYKLIYDVDTHARVLYDLSADHEETSDVSRSRAADLAR